MQIKTIYVNLPIYDVAKTRAFWEALGFAFNEQFSDERALCLVLHEDAIYVMLIVRDYFTTFTNRPIADATTTQVLTAIEVDAKEKVDALVSLALEMGATRYREGADHGWMYYDCFACIDGHQWEIMFTDASQLPQ